MDYFAKEKSSENQVLNSTLTPDCNNNNVVNLDCYREAKLDSLL